MPFVIAAMVASAAAAAGSAAGERHQSGSVGAARNADGASESSFRSASDVDDYPPQLPVVSNFGTNLALGIALGECFSAGLASTSSFCGGGGQTGGGGASGSW